MEKVWDFKNRVVKWLKIIKILGNFENLANLWESHPSNVKKSRLNLKQCKSIKNLLENIKKYQNYRKIKENIEKNWKNARKK